MAITYNNSDLMANTFASPGLLNPSGLDHTRTRINRGTFTPITTDSSGSIYRICQVQSGDWAINLLVSNTALGATGSFNFGLYTPNNGSVTVAPVAVSASLFAAAQALTAAGAFTSIRLAALTAASLKQQIWQMLGLSADPKLTYDLCATSTTAIAANGTVAVDYVFTN